MRSTLEKALEALINEDQATADQLFHDYILERSRRIHESIRQGEEVVLEDIMDDELTEGKSFKRNKDEDADEKKKQDKDKRDSRKPVDESEELEEGKSFKRNDDDEEDADEKKKQDKERKDAAKNKRNVSEDEDLAEGKSFKRGDDEDEEGDVKQKRKEDKQKRDARKPVEEGKLEAVQGDDGTLTITHTPEASVGGDDMGLPAVPPLPPVEPLDVPALPAPSDEIPDLSGTDDFAADADLDLEIGDDELSDDDFNKLGESLATELEKILVNTKDGDYAIGGNVKGEKHSPTPNVAADKRIDGGKPAEIKGDEHNGYDREPAPTSKAPNPKFANTVNKASDAQEPAKTGGKALLNQGGEDKSAKSPIGGK